MTPMAAYRHGLWVVASGGDLRRLRAMNAQVQRSNTVAMSWRSVEESLNRSVTLSQPTRSRSSH